MAKERSVNPVQAQRKADKAKAIKKGKAELIVRRNERLARRNPERIQQQIDELKAITTGGGKLTHHEEQVLGGLEKEIKAVTKAREQLGENAPTFGRGGPPRDGGDRDSRGVLGKRRRDYDDASSSESDVPEDVKSIPMPRDTPPPIPKEVLDKWYAKRRAKRSTNANMEPLGGDRRFEKGESEERQQTRSTPTPVVEAKTVYEAKPIVRDLRKEAVAFVPSVVRTKLDKIKGKGGLMEPEEADALEQQGYLKPATKAVVPSSIEVDVATESKPRNVMMEEVEDDEG